MRVMFSVFIINMFIFFGGHVLWKVDKMLPGELKILIINLHH